MAAIIPTGIDRYGSCVHFAAQILLDIHDARPAKGRKAVLRFTYFHCRLNCLRLFARGDRNQQAASHFSSQAAVSAIVLDKPSDGFIQTMSVVRSELLHDLPVLAAKLLAPPV
jgi:hypothetical protein